MTGKWRLPNENHVGRHTKSVVAGRAVMGANSAKYDGVRNIQKQTPDMAKNAML